MYKTIRLGNFRFTISMKYVGQTVGVNSRLVDGRHFLMWDFDTDSLRDVVASLRITQDKFALPKIYILRTRKGFTAISLSRHDFMDCCCILSYTKYICQHFYRLGVARGYWTLRIGKKFGNVPELNVILDSHEEETVSPDEINDFVIYEIVKW